jgi:hypothetical protein
MSKPAALAFFELTFIFLHCFSYDCYPEESVTDGY